MTFVDKNNKTWNLALDLGKVQEIDNADYSEITDQKVCLIKGDPTEVPAILTNTALMFAVIWVIVQDQIVQNLGMSHPKTEEDQQKAQNKFAKGIGGKQIEDARTALVEALSDFFPAAKTALLSLMQSL